MTPDYGPEHDRRPLVEALAEVGEIRGVYDELGTQSGVHRFFDVAADTGPSREDWDYWEGRLEECVIPYWRQGMTGG